jgi:hypothetical protein
MGITQCYVCGNSSETHVVHRARAKNKHYKWKAACVRAGIVLQVESTQISVCEDHFDEDSYYCHGTQLRLKDSAEPSIFCKENPKIVFVLEQVASEQVYILFLLKTFITQVYFK